MRSLGERTTSTSPFSVNDSHNFTVPLLPQSNRSNIMKSSSTTRRIVHEEAMNHSSSLSTANCPSAAPSLMELLRRGGFLSLKTTARPSVTPRPMTSRHHQRNHHPILAEILQEALGNNDFTEANPLFDVNNDTEDMNTWTWWGQWWHCEYLIFILGRTTYVASQELRKISACPL